MHTLIIGGTGLISTGITRLLLERGDQVTLFNRGQQAADIPAAAGRVVGDRTDYAAFEQQMAALGPFDCVIDMVGYAPEDGQSLVRAFAGRVPQLIFCSTVDVYSKPYQRYPVREDHERSPDPANKYAHHKAIIERTLEEAHARGDFALTILRPAHTYGEGRGPIHSFGGGTFLLDRMRKGKPVVVHGDGMSLWASCYRDDVARAFVAATGNAASYGKAYNVAGEEWMTWDHYHAGIAEALGVPLPRLVHIPSDLLARLAPKQASINLGNFRFDNIFDNTAAHTDLGFHQTVGWVDGVRRMVAWLDAHNQIENSDDETLVDRLIAAWDRGCEQMARDLTTAN